MDWDWYDNYELGGHAEQVRNNNWGRSEPAAAPSGWSNATATPSNYFNGGVLTYGNHVPQLPQQPNGSIAPGPEPTEMEPTEPEPTEPEPMNFEFLNCDFLDSEPLDTEPLDDEAPYYEPLDHKPPVFESPVFEPPVFEPLDLEPRESEPMKFGPTGSELLEPEPTEPELVEPEPTKLELIKQESSSSPDSLAEESEDSSSSSASKQKKKRVKRPLPWKRRSRKQAPAMRREVAANVPRRSRDESTNKAENGVDGKIKGQTRHDPHAGLQQRETEHDTWKNAVYHETIRSQLIDQAGLMGQYMEPRKSGPGEHNTTAFCQAQRDWSLDRTKWHLIQDNVLNRLERKEYGTNQTAVLGPMMWNNCVVIDHDNHIIINYDIPVTLSTEYEGQHMETCRRLMPHLSTRDFWARMPRLSVHPKTRDKSGVLTKTGKLSNRQDRFRRENGLLAWKNRQGTSTMKALVFGQLSDQQKLDNTTEGFTGLSKAQLKSLADKNKDSPASAGKRKYHEERKKRKAEELKDNGEGHDEGGNDGSPVQKKVRRVRKGADSDA